MRFEILQFEACLRVVPCFHHAWTRHLVLSILHTCISASKIVTQPPPPPQKKGGGGGEVVSSPTGQCTLVFLKTRFEPPLQSANFALPSS
mmetsp:Transcript_96894/g.167090  ORF Transcript_96894/g.167090 Transcript_96894/m.167090 type:complete len:90 (-) Transcript_96894:858-1127(-)